MALSMTHFAPGPALIAAALALVPLDARGAEPAPLQCYDLPGAVRNDLALTPNLRFLTWTQRNPDLRSDELHALNLETGDALIMDKGLRHGRVVAGTLVGLVTVEDGVPPTYALKVGKRTVAGPQGTSVANFVVDEARDRIYFTTSKRFLGEEVWSVTLSAGEATRVTVSAQVLGVVPDGSALILSAPTKKLPTLVRFPLDGAAPVVLADELDRAVLVGDAVYFNPAVAHNRVGLLQVVPASGGEATRLTGDPARVVPLGADSGMARSWGPLEGSRSLYRFEGRGAPKLVARVNGGDVRAALMLPGGKHLAMLVVHDTNADGAFDMRDEADVCIGDLTAAQAFDVEPRKAPKDFRHLMMVAPALAEGDLEGAAVRLEVIGERPTLVIETQASWAGDEEALFTRGVQVWRDLEAILKLLEERGASRPGVAPNVLVRWRGNERHVGLVHAPGARYPSPVAGAYGLSVVKRSFYRAAVRPTLKTISNYTWTKPHVSTCTGTVENLGSEPVDIEVECRLARSSDGGPAPAGKTVLRGVAPGKPKTYSIKLEATRFQAIDFDVTLTIAGERVPWFNGHALDELRHFTELADRIKAATGFSLDADAVVEPQPSASVQHKMPRLIAPGFDALPAKEQERIARFFWKEVQAHYHKHHSKQDIYGLDIVDASGKDRWVDRKGLSKIETPARPGAR